MTLTMGSLFDGIGGFPLAAERADITSVWASEIEPLPIAVTRRHFPQMRHYGNIEKISGWELPPVDIITGGSPCQDLSIAGARAGLTGERSGLLLHQIRIVKEMRERDEKHLPRFLVWENVPGAFGSHGGEDFKIVLEEICRIADGGIAIPRPPGGKWRRAGCILADEWSVAWRTVDAQFWGVPQRRKRIYLVADFGGQSAPKVLFEQSGVSGDTPQGSRARKGIAPAAKGGAGRASGHLNTESAGFNGYKSVSGSIQYARERAATIESNMPGNVFTATAGFFAGAAPSARTIGYGEECSPTLKAGESGTNMVPSILCVNDQGGQYIDLSLDITGTLRAKNKRNISYLFDNHAQDSRITGPLDKCPAVTQKYDTGGGNTPLAVDCRNLTGNRVSATLQAKENEGQSLNYINPVMTYQAVMSTGQANAEITYGIAPTINCDHEQPILTQNRNIIRRLTVTECERLQAYPDGWTKLKPIKNMTDRDLSFWKRVRYEKCAIDGKTPAKEWTKSQMIRWYNTLDSDSARYRALGNSVAVVNPEFIMHRIAKVLRGNAV